MRDTSFLGKLLALTESTNEHEANLAKAKLEQQLEKRGINLEQLEAQLGDMSVVEEEIEVIALDGVLHISVLTPPHLLLLAQLLITITVKLFILLLNLKEQETKNTKKNILEILKETFIDKLKFPLVSLDR